MINWYLSSYFQSNLQVSKVARQFSVIARDSPPRSAKFAVGVAKNGGMQRLERQTTSSTFASQKSQDNSLYDGVRKEGPPTRQCERSDLDVNLVLAESLTSCNKIGDSRRIVHHATTNYQHNYYSVIHKHTRIFQAACTHSATGPVLDAHQASCTTHEALTQRDTPLITALASRPEVRAFC